MSAIRRNSVSNKADFDRSFKVRLNGLPIGNVIKTGKVWHSTMTTVEAGPTFTTRGAGLRSAGSCSAACLQGARGLRDKPGTRRT